MNLQTSRVIVSVEKRKIDFLKNTQNICLILTNTCFKCFTALITLQVNPKKHHKDSVIFLLTKLMKIEKYAQN